LYHKLSLLCNIKRFLLFTHRAPAPGGAPAHRRVNRHYQLPHRFVRQRHPRKHPLPRHPGVPGRSAPGRPPLPPARVR